MKHGLLQSINTVFIDIENQILYDVGDQKTTLVSLDLAKYWAENSKTPPKTQIFPWNPKILKFFIFHPHLIF